MIDSLLDRKLQHLDEIAHVRVNHPNLSEPHLKHYIRSVNVHIRAIDRIVERIKQAVDLEIDEPRKDFTH